MASATLLDQYAEVPFDTRSIEQSRLDVVGGRRVNALPWRGQFTPELLDVLLDVYGFGSLNRVVDPFCGSGTTLMEAARRGYNGYGVEVNPSAFILARLYGLAFLAPDQRRHILRSADEFITQVLFASSSAESVAQAIGLVEDDYPRRVLEAIFLLTLGNEDQFSPSKLNRAFLYVGGLIDDLPEREVEITVELGDARSISMCDDMASMLLTSPPYVNVFNYHQNYRKAVELLGWNVLSAAKAELGANRKHRQNRFLTVIQYAQDIGLALLEAARIVESDGILIWIVGRESSVLGRSVSNSGIIYTMATRGAGLEVIGKHQRKFRSRYGALVYEDILVFRNGVDLVDSMNRDAIVALGRQVGVEVLLGLSKYEGKGSRELLNAIAMADTIEPSASPEYGGKPSS